MSCVEDLATLFDGTPLAVERVVAIWPGLTVMERTTLLPKLLEKPGALNYHSHRNRLLDLALADDNAFVRYLAARDVYEPREGAEPHEVVRYTKIQNDASPLVRYAHFENEFKPPYPRYTPEAFWSAPQPWRLAAVTGKNESCEEFAKLLLYASENLFPGDKLPEQEMVDVTLQYLTWKALDKRLRDAEEHAVASEDYEAQHMAGSGLAALWEIVLKVPRQVGFALLQHLPEPWGPNYWGVVGAILDGLDEHQKRVLLYRDDFCDFPWRKELFEKVEDRDIGLAALSHPDFRLDDSVITKLIFRPGEPLEEGLRKFNALKDLASYYYGATMAQSQGITRLLEEAPEEVRGHRYFKDQYFTRLICDRRVKTLRRDRLEQEYLELQILDLVWDLVPLRGEIKDDCPEVFRQYLVEGNPWDSYRGLRDAWNRRNSTAIAAAINEHGRRSNFGFTLPDDLVAVPKSEPPTQKDGTQVDALVRALPLKLNEMATSINRTRSLLWGVIVVMALLLFFRR